jgi:hypothetical protein
MPPAGFFYEAAWSFLTGLFTPLFVFYRPGALLYGSKKPDPYRGIWEKNATFSALAEIL